ncbi:MAG: hypothetical protein IJ678_00110 [Kiritimatiellae bacterium]|nr:hypothetical protein [Kiritimatiellia bacterium]MBR1835973.1 hypothetical protein [Kiritimatiellia bacterium]
MPGAPLRAPALSAVARAAESARPGAAGFLFREGSAAPGLVARNPRRDTRVVRPKLVRDF